jgi:predicted metal-dependent hydrolase
MLAQINLGEISVDVVFKDIKNVHLSVYPPTGRVRISAPERMKLDTIRIFAISKLDWIKRQQTKLQGQERETPREYLERESHYVWGRRYLLRVLEVDAVPGVELAPRTMILRVRPQATEEKKEIIVAQFYREQIRAAVPSLIAKWTVLLGLTVERLYVQQMKTKWGSCNPRARAIRLNTELAKKPKHCLEYILVHELVHLFEPRHGDRFVSSMDKFMPQWRQHREELNRHPLSHESWTY